MNEVATEGKFSHIDIDITKLPAGINEVSLDNSLVETQPKSITFNELNVDNKIFVWRYTHLEEYVIKNIDVYLTVK